MWTSIYTLKHYKKFEILGLEMGLKSLWTKQVGLSFVGRTKCGTKVTPRTRTQNRDRIGIIFRTRYADI